MTKKVGEDTTLELLERHDGVAQTFTWYWVLTGLHHGIQGDCGSCELFSIDWSILQRRELEQLGKPPR